MHIKFTDHAKWRIDERGVSMIHLEKTLKNPDTTKHSFDGASVARKAFAGKILEVVYIKGKKDVVVITA